MIMFIHLETHISSNCVNGGHSTCFPVQYFNCIMGNYKKNATAWFGKRCGGIHSLLHVHVVYMYMLQVTMTMYMCRVVSHNVCNNEETTS